MYHSDNHWIFENWWEYAKKHYLSKNSEDHLDWMTMYYDPMVDRNHLGGPQSWLGVAMYLNPQHREFARFLFESAAQSLKWTDSNVPIKEPPGNPRATLTGLHLAKEFGNKQIYANLRRHVETHHEPTFDTELGEFYYRFGLDEPYPRGQWNGTAIMADVGDEGAWWRIFNQPNLRKFSEPTVKSVDFDKIGISQAFYDAERKAMAVSIYPHQKTGTSSTADQTSFRITLLEDEKQYRVYRDDQPYLSWVIQDGDLEIKTSVGEHAFFIVKESI